MLNNKFTDDNDSDYTCNPLPKKTFSELCYISGGLSKECS